MTSALGVVTVEFKEYGIKLDIEPEVDEHQNIISRVRAEVSAIDPSVAIDDVPGLLTRKAESVINVKNKETMVISGLVNSEMSKSVSRFPLLGDIPSWENYSSHVILGKTRPNWLFSLPLQ